MHGQPLAERLQVRGPAGALHGHQHPDLAQARRQRVVHVRCKDARLHGEHRRPANPQVFADGCDQAGQLLLDGLAGFRVDGAFQGLQVAAGVQRQAGDRSDEVLESLVARHEVGLRVDLDDGARGAVDGDADKTLRGHPTGHFGRRRQALLA